MNQPELAKLIINGLNTECVCESPNFFYNYIRRTHYACALGLAVIGKIGPAIETFQIIEKAKKRNFERTHLPFDYLKFFADFLGLDIRLAKAIEKEHFSNSLKKHPPDVLVDSIVEKLKRNKILY